MNYLWLLRLRHWIPRSTPHLPDHYVWLKPVTTVAPMGTVGMIMFLMIIKVEEHDKLPLPIETETLDPPTFNPLPDHHVQLKAITTGSCTFGNYWFRMCYSELLELINWTCYLELWRLRHSIPCSMPWLLDHPRSWIPCTLCIQFVHPTHNVPTSPSVM